MTRTVDFNLVVPRLDETCEEALSRRCRELLAKVTEQDRIISDAATELTAEISRRAEIQSALLQAQKLEALGHLTSGITHDFGSILQAISASLLLLEMKNPSAEQADLITQGKLAVDQAAALIRRLLAFVRKEAQTLGHIVPADLFKAVEPLIKQILGFTIVHNFAAAADCWPVAVDMHEFDTVLLNLAVNARDAMPKGGRLAITARNSPRCEAKPPGLADGDHVMFSVADTGTGMPPEVLARATEAFFTTKGPEKGTGLGLAMASTFATRSGGLLVIDSRAGEGTTISIYLPRAMAEGAEAPHPTARASVGGIALLAEEREVERILSAQRLRSLGYQVIEAANLQVALALSYGIPALDVAVISWTLTGGGSALADRLRIERPGLPVLMLVEGDFAENAADPILTRPFGAAEMAMALRGCLAEKAAFDAREATLSERMKARIRPPALKKIHAEWRHLRGCSMLPRIEAANHLMGELGDHHFTAAIAIDRQPARFRFLSVGQALSARIEHELTDTEFCEDDVEIFGSLSATYAMTARTHLPVYDWLRLSLGDTPTRFDRLILPMSEDGTSVSHLVGFVLMDGEVRA